MVPCRFSTGEDKHTTGAKIVLHKLAGVKVTMLHGVVHSKTCSAVEGFVTLAKDTLMINVHFGALEGFVLMGNEWWWWWWWKFISKWKNGFGQFMAFDLCNIAIDEIFFHNLIFRMSRNVILSASV